MSCNDFLFYYFSYVCKVLEVCIHFLYWISQLGGFSSIPLIVFVAVDCKALWLSSVVNDSVVDEAMFH